MEFNLNIYDNLLNDVKIEDLEPATDYSLEPTGQNIF